MKIVLLGAPGSGKGTNAKFISEHFNIPHISTGDLFRENMANNTPLGQKVKEIMSTGSLCPDELTIDMVRERLNQQDCKNGYLLDGFPRDLLQAKALELISAPNKVVNIDVEISKLEKRIVGRRICSKCHNTYNTSIIGETTICPDCGGELIHRKDDTPEILKKRLEVYQNETQPLIDFYSNKGVLVTVDGGNSLDEIQEEIKKVLK